MFYCMFYFTCDRSLTYTDGRSQVVAVNSVNAVISRLTASKSSGLLLNDVILEQASS